MYYKRFRQLIIDLLRHIGKKDVNEIAEIVNSVYYRDRHKPKKILATIILQHFNNNLYLVFNKGKIKDVSTLDKLLPYMDCVAEREYKCLIVPNELFNREVSRHFRN